MACADGLRRWPVSKPAVHVCTESADRSQAASGKAIAIAELGEIAGKSVVGPGLDA